MKRSFLLLIAICTCLFSNAQVTEFERPDNGLIYADSTIKQLRFIVDSLNIKFRVCELQKPYYSKAQALAHYISLDTGDIKAARQDIINGISFDAFLKKYPDVTIDSNLMVVRFNYKNYDEKDELNFSSVEMEDHREHSISFTENLDQLKRTVKGAWVFKYHEKTTYSGEDIEAFYLFSNFETKPLPEKYARLVQYADCMIDTTAEIFNDRAKTFGAGLKSENKQISEFTNYVDLKTGRPELKGKYTETKYEKYRQKLQVWDSLRFIITDSLRATDITFNELFGKALKEALENGSGGDEFEEYVARYDSKKTALQLKRNRRVVGTCSQDQSPRIHAMNIAQLSAETVNWETFLRSHLDIMNDRFERISDGSYAWARRKTYIKELELLDINLDDLLFGISLRIENPAEHHYYGSIGRLGRAVAESKHRVTMENKMLNMIGDMDLDDYNRVLIYYLYLNCSYYLENKDLQKKNLEKLKPAIASLPGYIRSKIRVEAFK